MLLHQHLQTAEWYTEHLSKLHRINCIFLSVEHTRFCVLNIFQLLDPIIITTHSLVLNLSLGFLVLHI